MRKFSLWYAVVFLTLTGMSCSSQQAAPSSSGIAEGVVSGQNIFDYGASHRSQQKAVDAAQDKIKICMKNEGFEYVADVAPAPTPLEQALSDADMSDKEFASEWGFGLIVGQGFDVVEEDQLDPEDVEKQKEQAKVGDYDPVEDLGVAEGSAYIEALFSEDGCQRQAYSESREDGIRFDSQFDQIDAALASFSVSSEMSDFYSEWRDCMKSQGYDYISPLAIRLDIEQQVRDADMNGQTSKIVDEIQPFELEVAVVTVGCEGPVRSLLPEELADAWLTYAGDLR